MSPAEAGTLVDENAAMRDITATIVDLAVRGYIVIEEKEKTGMMGLIHNKEYVFHLKKGLNEWTGLKAHELGLLGGIFANGEKNDVELSTLQNQFYRSLPGIKNNIFDALMEHGYFQHRPDYVRSGFMGGAVVAGVLFAAVEFRTRNKMGMAPAPFFIGGHSLRRNHRRLRMVYAGAHFGWDQSARGRAGL